MKHDPGLLLDVAAATREDFDVVVVVVSQGPGREWLERERSTVENLVLLDYQPYDVLPEVLASGDVLITLLEPDAGQFSVPSKILSNLCAGRPQVVAVPAENLGARTVERSGGGVVVDPRNRAAFVDAVRRRGRVSGLPFARYFMVIAGHETILVLPVLRPGAPFNRSSRGRQSWFRRWCILQRTDRPAALQPALTIQQQCPRDPRSGPRLWHRVRRTGIPP